MVSGDTNLSWNTVITPERMSESDSDRAVREQQRAQRREERVGAMAMEEMQSSWVGCDVGRRKRFRGFVGFGFCGSPLRL